jgi:uncharacterized membrane protein SpoIIM required for sporulation
MFLMIAFNNIQVYFWVYVLGIFAAVWTVYLLFTNGIMLGSFEYFFFSKGLGWKSLVVVFVHGTIEISAIIIAGAAGLILGKSWMFPGTYKRMESLKSGAKDSLKIVLGLVPFFLVAAFLEGFITRHTEMPLWLSISILMASLFLIGWYFVIYPKQMMKRIEAANRLDKNL